MRAAIALVALLAACSQEADQADDDTGSVSAANAASRANAPPAPVVVESQGAATQVGGPRAETLCEPEERQLFSCTARGGKLASVCLAAGLEGTFAQYRFGPRGAPELVWPASPQQGAIEWASVPYSGGGEAQLSFARGDTRYVVYSKIVRTNFTPGEPNDPAITDGVAVLRGGRLVAQHSCEASTALKSVDTYSAEKYLRKADDLFTYDID